MQREFSCGAGCMNKWLRVTDKHRNVEACEEPRFQDLTQPRGTSTGLEETCQAGSSKKTGARAQRQTCHSNRPEDLSLKPYVWCQYCPRWMEEKEYKRHRDACKGTRYFECVEHGKKFFRREHYEKHRRAEHRDTGRDVESLPFEENRVMHYVDACALCPEGVFVLDSDRSMGHHKGHCRRGFLPEHWCPELQLMGLLLQPGVGDLWRTFRKEDEASMNRAIHFLSWALDPRKHFMCILSGAQKDESSLHPRVADFRRNLHASVAFGALLHEITLYEATYDREFWEAEFGAHLPSTQGHSDNSVVAGPPSVSLVSHTEHPAGRESHALVNSVPQADLERGDDPQAPGGYLYPPMPDRNLPRIEAQIPHDPQLTGLHHHETPPDALTHWALTQPAVGYQAQAFPTTLYDFLLDPALAPGPPPQLQPFQDYDDLENELYE